MYMNLLFKRKNGDARNDVFIDDIIESKTGKLYLMRVVGEGNVLIELSIAAEMYEFPYIPDSYIVQYIMSLREAECDIFDDPDKYAGLNVDFYKPVFKTL